LCAVLVPPKKSAVNPHPISREDFHTLLAKANPQMKAILLLCLNTCHYLGEGVALRWSDIDLEKRTLVCNRTKTGIVRVAVLWPETIEALRVLPKTTDTIFTSAASKAPYTYQAIYQHWSDLRRLAGVPHVQSTHLRDGAYTTAIDSGCDLNRAKLLAGNTTGIPDHYVKRNPKMVAAECEAIHEAYFGNEPGRK
jgi:integrase